MVLLVVDTQKGITDERLFGFRIPKLGTVYFYRNVT